MPACPTCGSNLEGHEAFCPYCSTPLQAEPTAQWAPPGFEEDEAAHADDDWTVALWGEPEPTVVEEPAPLPTYETVVEERIPSSIVEETITLPAATTSPEWYQNRLVLALIALSAILFVGLILAVLDRGETVVLPTPAATPLPAIAVTPQPTNEIPEGERPVVSQTPISVSPAPTPAPTPASDKTWTQVASLEGSGPKKGTVFELTGGEAKLIYTVEGDQFAGMAVYVVREGESIDEQGGSPDVNHQGSGSDETRIVKPAGRYYLDVNSANATWSVRVEELK